jgi:alkylation response protein AidB-like acyl-CoA dehydrogenase
MNLKLPFFSNRKTLNFDLELELELDLFCKVLRDNEHNLSNDEFILKILKENHIVFLPCFERKTKQLYEKISRILFEIGQISVPLGVALCMHYYVLASFSTFQLSRFSSKSILRELLLKRIITSRTILANTGSVKSFKGKESLMLRRSGKNYNLNGTGSFMSFCGIAGIVLLTVKDDEGVPVLLMVDLNSPGIVFGIESKNEMMKDSRTRQITFKNVQVGKKFSIRGESNPEIALFQRAWFQGLLPSLYLGAAFSISSELKAISKSKYFIKRSKNICEMEDFKTVASRLHVSIKTGHMLAKSIGSQLSDYMDNKCSILNVCKDIALVKYYVAEKVIAALREMIGFFGVEGVVNIYIQKSLTFLTFAAVQPMSSIDLIQYYSDNLFRDS